MTVVPLHVMFAIPVHQQACPECCLRCCDIWVFEYENVHAGLIEFSASEWLYLVQNCAVLPSNAISCNVLRECKLTRRARARWLLDAILLAELAHLMLTIADCADERALAAH